MHIRCPHCCNPIELADDQGLHDVTCPSCGSSFDLLSEETITYQSGEQKTLGHFALIERIGVGAFGEVWKARDSSLDRIVAVKIPRKGQLNSSEAEQFLREAKSAARLSHPSVVSVHEVGDDHGQLYIVSDFVQGATLAEWLTTNRPNWRDAGQLCAKLGDALHHAHEHGVIHRDLKPSNVMIDVEGEPHIMDFGLAKRDAGEITMTIEGKVLGTPAYMSPEQAKGEAHQADRRTDIYSLGVILFELLTGELPFRGSERMLIVQILRDEPPSPRRLNAQIPRDLETICLKCLEKDREKRYATAQDLAMDLRRWLRGEAILARQIGRVGRGWRWCKRNPLVASLTAATMALLAAAATLGLGGYVVTKGALAVAESERARAEHSAAAERRALEKETAALDKTERSLYIARVNVAALSWEQADVATAQRLLDACPAEHRDWEWRYINWQVQSGFRTFEGHEGAVSSAAFSPDGRRIASGSWDRTARLWDAASGKQELVLHVTEDNFVPALAFSADGTRLVVSTFASTHMWDVATGKDLFALENGGDVHSLAVSTDGRLIAGGQTANIGLWDAQTGRRLGQLAGLVGEVVDVAFGPDEDRIACYVQGKGVTIWSLRSPEKLIVRGSLQRLAWSQDGSMLASGGDDFRLKLLDTVYGQEPVTVLTYESGYCELPNLVPRSCSFGPGGKIVAAINVEGTISLWDVVTGSRLRLLGKHSALPTAAAFSDDVSRLASGSQDGTVKIWEVSSGKELRTLTKSAVPIRAVAFDPVGRLLATAADDGNIQLWVAESGQPDRELRGHEGPVRDLAWLNSEPARLVSAGADGSIRLWNAVSGEVLQIIKAHRGEVRSISCQGNGQLIVSSGADQLIRLWDAASDGNVESPLLEIPADTPVVAISTDGKRIVSGGPGHYVRMWDSRTGEAVLAIPAGCRDIRSVTLSDDGRHLAALSVEGRLRI